MNWKIWRQKRHILVFLVSLGVFTLYVCRSNLSVAIVAMTVDRYETLSNGTQIKQDAEFQWSNVIQGYLLSSFFYGYVVALPIGGIFGRKIGGKNALALTVSCASLVSLISPWLAKWNPYALLVGRVCTGLLEGVTYPSLYIIFSKWVPESEKSRVTAQIHGGNYAGTLFSMLFFGYLSEVAGWRSLFWFSGAIGIIWVIIWTSLTTETPREHSSISTTELLYIEESVKSYALEDTPIPYKILLTSLPIWALSLAFFAEHWAFVICMSFLPKYYNDVYDIDLSKTGILSSLPYILLVTILMTVGQISDRIIAKRWFSITLLRKITISGSFLIEAIFLLGAAYWQNITGTVVCLIISVGMGGISKSGLAALPFDLCPKCSGFIYGIVLSVGSIAGVIAPSISGYILTNNPTLQEWRNVFFLTSGILPIAAIVFALFGSAEKIEFTSEEKSDSLQVN